MQCFIQMIFICQNVKLQTVLSRNSEIHHDCFTSLILCYMTSHFIILSVISPVFVVATLLTLSNGCQTMISETESWGCFPLRSQNYQHQARVVSSVIPETVKVHAGKERCHVGMCMYKAQLY